MDAISILSPSPPHCRGWNCFRLFSLLVYIIAII